MVLSFGLRFLIRGKVATVVLLGMALPHTAQAQQLINFDLNVGGGGDIFGPGAAVLGSGTSTWNTLSRVSSPSSLALTDDTGAATSVTITYSRLSSGSFPQTGSFVALGNSHIGSGDVSFAGLASGGTYKLIIFSAWNGTPSFTVNGITKTITPSTDWSTLTEGRHYVSFVGTADGSGNLFFTPNANPTGVSGASSWSAFQLQQQVSTPEPTTLSLLTLGVIGGIVARRGGAFERRRRN